MSDGKIHIPVRKKETTDRSEIVRISAEAYNTLVEIFNESTLSMSQVASMLILGAKDLVIYDKED